MRNKFYFLGKNVELYTMNFGTEPYLISIHDNAVCASGVRFINHDVSVHRVAYYLGLKRTDIDKVGSIELFENSFVGAYSILMPIFFATSTSGGNVAGWYVGNSVLPSVSDAANTG